MKKLFTVLLASSLITISLPALADTDASTNPLSMAPNYKAEATMPVAATAADTRISPLSGNFTITSNYVFRGVSVSDNLPAVQGGLTYTFLSSGIYANLWGSNVNFQDAQGYTATLEMDTIIGISNPIGDHFTYDINLDRYNYPKAGASYNEGIANAHWYFITAQIAYSNNVYNSHYNGIYYNLGFKQDVPAKYALGLENVTVSGGVGHYDLNDAHKPGVLSYDNGLSSYNDYNLQVTKGIGNYTIGLQWTDTNGHSADPAPLRDWHLIGTVAVNFA